MHIMHISQHKPSLAARPCLHAQGAEGKLGLAEYVNSTPRNEHARAFNCGMFSGVGILGGYQLTILRKNTCCAHCLVSK